MSQPAQHCLIRVLLLWITILTIIQVVFIVIFFTAGHHDRHQNCSTLAPEHAMQSMPDKRPLSLSENGKMLTFKGSTGNGRVKWEPKYPINGLLSLNEEEVLTIEKDGYYFIILQVKLKTCSLSEGLKVSLKWTNVSQQSTDILEGLIKNDTCSTGLLAKVVALTEGTLEVTIDKLQTHRIDETESLTHLDIIYMS